MRRSISPSPIIMRNSSGNLAFPARKVSIPLRHERSAIDPLQGRAARPRHFRIETALIKGGDTPLIGHKLFNAETDELCTVMQQQLRGITLSILSNGTVTNVRNERYQRTELGGFAAKRGAARSGLDGLSGGHPPVSNKFLYYGGIRPDTGIQ